MSQQRFAHIRNPLSCYNGLNGQTRVEADHLETGSEVKKALSKWEYV